MKHLLLEHIKENAINKGIPIIMDDTLEYIDKILSNHDMVSILESGSAVRIFCNVLYKIYI